MRKQTIKIDKGKTPLAKKIVKEIVEPAISRPYLTEIDGTDVLTQELDYVVLLKKMKEFYEKVEAEEKDFYKVMEEAGYLDF